MKDKEKDMEKNKKKNNDWIYNVLIVFFVLIFIGSAAYLFRYFLQNKKSEENFENLKGMIEEADTNESDTSNATALDAVEYVTVNGKKIQKKYQAIYEKNNDFVGWLTIEGTKVDYPVVMKMEDEEYYLRRDFDGNKSTAGTVFVDTSSDLEIPSDNILLYGHNMKAGTMFHDILEYQKESFYKNHKYIRFDTIYGNGLYEVIAAFKTEIKPKEYEGFKYYEFYFAQSEAEFDEYVKNCKALTTYDTGETAKYGDKLLTLSTCSYHANEGRFVVVAKKINDK